MTTKAHGIDLGKMHAFKAGAHSGAWDDATEFSPAALRKQIEPWLSAVVQSEHLSLLVGSGLTIGVGGCAEVDAPSMDWMSQDDFEFETQVRTWATAQAAKMGRSSPNLEDQLSTLLLLEAGLEITNNPKSKVVSTIVERTLRQLIQTVIETETALAEHLKPEAARDALISFLLSFASRTGSRERLNLFTTNYDRVIERACDLVGVRTIDRFVGGLTQVFRASRLDVDLHYNPPGIRGEPRFLEGVIRFAKLHGSVDWRLEDFVVTRHAVQFGGAEELERLHRGQLANAVVFPNSSKEFQTSQYPYAELLRDFSASICRPNSVLVTYGYGFGDTHINRIIADMLSIPSTHLVLISYNDPDDRAKTFIDSIGRHSQLTLLLASGIWGN